MIPEENKPNNTKENIISDKKTDNNISDDNRKDNPDRPVPDKNDKQSRKWQITINNPAKKGLSHDALKELLSQIKPVQYYCMSDEMGSTHHTHIYICCMSPVRFSTLKNKFPTAHIELARGTSIQNRDYVFKEGKWEKDKKHETNLRDTHEEYGEMPIERQGARNDLADLYDMIKQGASDYEILDSNPEYLNHIERMEKVRQTIYRDLYKKRFRELDVTYIWGDTGSGKTRSVMEEYGYINVYRITSYAHPFDGYKNEPVILFDEFRSSLPLSDMLNYLDGYPLSLPCRYNDRTACYTVVFIVSNIDLRLQYDTQQRTERETWRAFLRRIQKVKVFKDNRVALYTMEQYLYGFLSVPEDEGTPFDKEGKHG